MSAPQVREPDGWIDGFEIPNLQKGGTARLWPTKSCGEPEPVPVYFGTPPTPAPEREPTASDGLASLLEHCLKAFENDGRMLRNVQVRDVVERDIRMTIKHLRSGTLEEWTALHEADTARLDWLENAAASLHCNYYAGPECFTVTVHDVFNGTDTAHHGPAVRAAIDAAMRAHAPLDTEKSDG